MAARRRTPKQERAAAIRRLRGRRSAKRIGKKFKSGRCPRGLPDMCRLLDRWGGAWKDWGLQVDDALGDFSEAILRLEDAVCNLEGHLVYGKALGGAQVCNAAGDFRVGTLHRVTGGPYDAGEPPDEPFGG